MADIPAPARLALIGIVVEKQEAVQQLNAVLHDYADYIIGRMGIPCRRRGVSLISLALEAPQDIISALGGRLGSLDGLTCKTVCTKG